MKIEFITNASVLVTLASKKTVLCDPWYTDAIYYGSWYNFPPLANKKHYQSLKPSYIYISHIHPDHLDGESLRRYPRDTEIWLGNLPHRQLENRVRSLGFQNIKLFNLGETTDHDALKITIFRDFAGSSFGDPNEVDYAMDTSLHVQDTNGESLFNINDNTIQPEDAGRVAATFGSPTVALVPYSGASHYPHAFRHYTDAEKRDRTKQLTDKMCRRFVDISRALMSEWVVPVAGSYVMGGEIASYSEYLHQATPAQLTDVWQRQFGGESSKMVFLFEGDVLDSETGTVARNSKALFRDFSAEERVQYAESLSTKVLPHERVTIPEVFALPWRLLFMRARANLWRYQEKFRTFPNWTAELHLKGIDVAPFIFGFDSAGNLGVDPGDNGANSDRGRIAFHIDYRLMLMILVRAAHWNNVEIGALVEVERKPDLYEPTIHSLMSFFHL